MPRKHQRNSIQGHHPTPLGICFPTTEPLHFTEHKIEAVGLQRHAAPFVFGYYNYGPTSGLTHDIHHRLKWIPLQHRRALYDLALFYKIRSRPNVINMNFPPIVGPTTILATTKQMPHEQALYSDAYKYNFFNSTIRSWNIIPNQALSSANINHFRTITCNWMTPFLGVKQTAHGHSSNKQVHVCGLILERSLAEALRSLNVIVLILCTP